MSLCELTLAEWAAMSDEAAHRECEALARRLPHGLKFSGLKQHSYCGRVHRVARFSRTEAGDLVHFVLMPGGEVSLGYDGSQFKPRPWQLQSFEGWREQMVSQGADPSKVKRSINDYVDWETSSPRTACLPAVLIEVEAQPIAPRDDLEALDPDDPEFGRLANLGREHGAWEVHSGIPWQPHYLIEVDDDAVRIRRRQPTTVQYVEDRLAKSGMRLPTSDEWEYACGAGAKTLFRWGDDAPCDFYPTDTCAEDREAKRAWAMSAGRLPYEQPPPGWDLHTQPNLFGLRIAEDPYRMEVVAGDAWGRGGDGGHYICGGAGSFLGWLPLATAYRPRFSDMGRRADRDNVADRYHRLRRVIPLS